MLIEKLSGSTWIKQAIPVIGSESQLVSVAVLLADKAWAVGYTIKPSTAAAFTLVLHQGYLASASATRAFQFSR